MEYLGTRRRSGGRKGLAKRWQNTAACSWNEQRAVCIVSARLRRSCETLRVLLSPVLICCRVKEFALDVVMLFRIFHTRLRSLSLGRTQRERERQREEDGGWEGVTAIKNEGRHNNRREVFIWGRGARS